MYKIRKYFKEEYDEGYSWIEKDGHVTIGKRTSMQDQSPITFKLQDAYKAANQHEFQKL